MLDADFRWNSVENNFVEDSEKIITLKPLIQDIKLEINSGTLLAVVGSVGSGKSSFLSAILGEMEKVRGVVQIHGQVAYFPQTPWIQNLSLRENILFGRPYNKAFFDKVIEACCLTSDLQLLQFGDATEIGEKV